MDKSELKDLREKYPSSHYDVIEKDGKLTITVKKAVVWLPRRFFVELPIGNPQKLSNRIFFMIKNSVMDKQHFMFEQKVITTECAQEIARRAKKCGATRQAYITALLEENKSNSSE